MAFNNFKSHKKAGFQSLSRKHIFGEPQSMKGVGGRGCGVGPTVWGGGGGGGGARGQTV